MGKSKKKSKKTKGDEEQQQEQPAVQTETATVVATMSATSVVEPPKTLLTTSVSVLSFEEAAVEVEMQIKSPGELLYDKISSIHQSFSDNSKCAEEGRPREDEPHIDTEDVKVNRIVALFSSNLLK
jgi:hypothetical protein